jgi:hypothetical protein
MHVVSRTLVLIILSAVALGGCASLDACLGDWDGWHGYAGPTGPIGVVWTGGCVAYHEATQAPTSAPTPSRSYQEQGCDECSGATQ